jgi:hypothetical protein
LVNLRVRRNQVERELTWLDATIAMLEREAGLAPEKGEPKACER